MSDRVTVAPSWLRSAVTSIFTEAGLSTNAAETVAESLVAAEMRGINSHGALLVPMYVERLLAGSVSSRDEAEVVVDAGAIAVLDAHHAFGQLSGDQAMEIAVSKAKLHGLGAVVVRRAFHFGGAFRYVQAAAGAGCIGIAAADPPPRMLVFGAIDYAAAVASIGSFLGHHVTVCDARRVFATASRFPAADRVVVSWPRRFLAEEVEAGRVDDQTVICVLTHDPKFDGPCWSWPSGCRRSAISAPWAPAGPMPTASCGCARPASRRRSSTGCPARSGSTSRPGPPRRPR
jgi:hypothetical protein